MKRFWLMLALLAFLTGCGGPSTPVVEEELETEAAPPQKKEPGQGKPVNYWIAPCANRIEMPAAKLPGCWRKWGNQRSPRWWKYSRTPMNRCGAAAG